MAVTEFDHLPPYMLDAQLTFSIYNPIITFAPFQSQWSRVEQVGQRRMLKFDNVLLTINVHQSAFLQLWSRR